MDPNQNLRDQERILHKRKTETHLPSNYGAVRLTVLRQALAGWLARGGFEPDWTTCPMAAKAFKAWQRKQAA